MPGDVGGYWVIPVDFAVDAKSGDIFIADEENSRISKFNTAGELTLSFGIEKKSSHYSPMSIELDGQKHIIVFDNEKIQIFDAQGKLLDVLSTPGGSESQDDLFVDVNDNIYLRDPEWILKFTRGQRQPIVYKQQSLAQYLGALITPTGNILTFRDGFMILSNATRVIKQVRIETADGLNHRRIGHPIGFGRDGNIYFYSRRRSKSGRLEQNFSIRKIDTNGKLVFSREVSTPKSVKYQGQSINWRMWHWERLYVDWDGNVYFLKATSAGAEIWKLSTN